TPDVPDVAFARDHGEAEKLAARLVALHHREQRTAWRNNFAGAGFVVARGKLRRARLALERRPALPCIPIGSPRAIGEHLGDGVETLKPDAHPSLLSSCRERRFRRCWPAPARPRGACTPPAW